MITTEIEIIMKSGRKMKVEATGSIYLGETDELTCFWPRTEKRPEYRVIDPDLYDTEDAADKYYQATIEDYKNRYLYQKAEAAFHGF